LARKILLADDSVTAQNMGRKILTEAGYEVITVNNGSAALKRITEQKPDVIVLDVYMPGYGGLEVCHRLKENPETARIPVLLTVGKLEPFKAEEARRVRADMHIIKPFDTSELLSAIAKLEDRIVAQAEMPKKGRFAKPGAEEAPPPDSYGDQQSGWKSRLIAPRKKAKAEKSELKAEAHEEIKDVRPEPPRAFNSDEGLEEDTVNAKDWRTLLSTREAEEKAATANAERQIEQGEIEENAKSKGVADVVRPKTQQRAHEHGEKRASEKEGTTPAERDIALAASAETAAEIVARAEAAVQAEKAEEDPAEIRETPRAAEPTQATAADRKQVRDEREDRDVADALASLAPVPNENNVEPANDRELVATGVHKESFSGPRWMAQAVLVSQEESSSLLEQEMEQAFKHFAAAEPPASFSMGPLEAMSFSAPADDEEAPERQPYNQPEQVVEPAPVGQAGAAIPDPEVALAADAHPPTQLETKAADEGPAPAGIMGALWMSTPAAYVAATAGPHAAENQLAQASPDARAPETIPAESAFAAAAGALAPSFAAESEPAEIRVESGNKESDLAAAWQSWREVREGDAQPAASPAPQPEAKAESNNDDETHGEEISSLVDTMLAELKPKLMKEIAKKMGKEKDKGKR
jgi:CheY-like chemotaxis protein